MKNDKYAITYRQIDLTEDYEGDEIYTAMGMYFGIILAADAVVKVTNSDGATETLTLPAGYHPGQFKKIFKNTDGTNVASIVIFY